LGKLRALGPLTGLTDIARVKAAMIRSARPVILLADSSKWGHTTFAKIAPLLEIDVLVTDSGLPESERKAFAVFARHYQKVEESTDNLEIGGDPIRHPIRPTILSG